MTNRIAVHDWSLDRTLGGFRTDTPELAAAGALTLLDLPAALRAHDLSIVQFCHFHLPSQEPAYLADLRGALLDNEVVLDTYLIDAGDITHPETGARDEEWIAGQIRTAVALGAERVRVIAGKTRTPDAVEVSSRILGRLADRNPDIRVVTENWFDVAASSEDVIGILEPLEGSVGLLIDLANWTGRTKYDELARITRFAETCHAKAHWDGAAMDEDDYRLSVSTVLGAGYDGPFALVYTGDDSDEWSGLAAQRAVVESELARS